MKNQKIVWGVGGVLLGLLLSMLYFSPAGGMMGNYSQNRSGIDAHFIEQMIPHHEDAITMAKEATVKSKRPEILQLAEDIKRTQSEEIAQMEEWYTAWFGAAVPEHLSGMGVGGMHMGMMGNQTDLSRLSRATDFDATFIEEMIPHHQMAVMMANMLLRTTTRPEMIQLAKNIIEAQTREIEAMREWYTAWYGR